MSDNSLKKGRFTKYSNRIGLFSNQTGNYIANTPEVVLNFPFKDTVLEAGMNKEDVGRDERFLHLEIDKRDIDTLEEPKVLTNFKYIDQNGEIALTANSDIEFFDENGNLKQNLLIKGNNLLALHSLKERLSGRIKLIYIDPPYNTGSDGFKYNDSFNHSSWLTFMRNRLEVAYDLLSKDGAIFISCDDNEQAYLKVLMDEIFGMNNFKNTIAVKMSEASGVKMNHAKIRFPKIKEYILFYVKDNENFSGFETIEKYKIDNWDSENNIFLENFTEEDRKRLYSFEEKEVLSDDDVAEINRILQPVKCVSLQEKLNKLGLKNGDKKTTEWLFDNAFRIIKTAGSSSLANLIKTKYPTPDTSQDIKADTSKQGVLFYYITNFNRETNQPRIQVLFADLGVFKNPCDFWQDIKTTGAIANEGGVLFPNGKKPEKLLKRIINMTTKEGDIVLDFCLGSGSTSAVAHKMNRRWIGIEQMDYIDTLAKKRLVNVINGDQTGISSEVKWQGGGSFVYMELKKYNQAFLDRLMEVTSISDVEEVYSDMQKNAFLKFFFDKKEFEKDENFRSKTWEQRRNMLVDILDENQLYLNLLDMRDAKYKVNNDEMALTERFYGVQEDAEN